MNRPGTYWASITNACGTVSDTVVYIQNPAPLVNPANDVSICPGQAVMLNASNPGATYLWNTGSPNQAITVNTAGIYWVDLTMGTCTARDSMVVTALFPHLLFRLAAILSIAPAPITFFLPVTLIQFGVPESSLHKLQ